MYKLLIVDDEPLVQVGIKSMLNWQELNIEVIGTAVNGQIALKLIQEQSPDIVITDIKMPVMDGLELIKLCRESCGSERPVFLILTSYEDFHMVKEALTYRVSDYLVKLELTPQSLREAMERVLERIQKTEEIRKPAESIVHPFYDKFFIRLLNNLFESEEQFTLQSRDLSLDFHYRGYICCYGEMTQIPPSGSRQFTAAMPPDSHSDSNGQQNGRDNVSCGNDGSHSAEKQLLLFTTSMHMLRELAGKYHPCYVLSLDTRHFALIFCYEEIPEERDSADCLREVSGILNSIRETLTKYYNISFRCGIGNLVDRPLSICDSYQYSRHACHITNDASPIACFDDCTRLDYSHSSFNISLFKDDLTRAFEEYDADTLARTLDTLCELFLAHPNHYVQALDGACNILFLAISLLQDGEKIVSDIFVDYPDGYRSIYKQTNVEQIVSWLNCFKREMCLLFENHHKDYKNHIVTNVRKYIVEHVTEHLSLNEVAAVFGISPNYLSQLFGKHNDVGFTEYINICKINEAKHLLDNGTLKVYEVAECLGFDSSFYFSKVFKRVEGISPTEYINGKV